MVAQGALLEIGGGSGQQVTFCTSAILWSGLVATVTTASSLSIHLPWLRSSQLPHVVLKGHAPPGQIR